MTTRLGNMADVARELKISRAAVSRQVKRRDQLGTPLPAEDTGLYDLDKYRSWYTDDFSPRSGPRGGIRAKS